MHDDAEHHVRLIERVATGDEAAFGALYDCFSRSLYSLGVRMLNDRGRSEEMVQEAMTKVWRGAASFEATKGRPSSWIFTIARRTTLDMIRREARSATVAELVHDEADSAGAESAEWRDWEIGVLLGALPEEQRVPVEMFVLQGYTHAEVAERLGVPVGTIKTRVYSGLRTLRAKLEAAGIVEVTA